MKFFLKPWIIVIIVLVLATGGYFIYRNVKAKQDTTSYKTATVSKGTLTATVTGTGNIIAVNEASVSPSISGKVTDLSVKAGDQVKAGQVLFKIENSTLDTSVDKAYASYLQAKQGVTDAEDALTNAKNNKTTVDDNSKSTDSEKTIAAQKVTSAENAIPIAQINLKTAYANYTKALEDANERTVKAPIDGTIVTVNIKNGDQLGSSGGSSASSSSSSSSSNSGGSSAIVIDDLSNMKASVSLNEVDAASVKEGQSATMTFDAIDGLTLTGKVESISAVGTESSGVVTYPAIITFDSLDSSLKPEMSLTAIITTEVKQDVLMVPNAAVKTSGDSSYVLVMKNGTPEKQTVEVGIANDTYTEIVSGVSEGESVVIQTITSSSSSSTSSSSNSKSSNSSSLNGLTGGGGPPSGGGPGM